MFKIKKLSQDESNVVVILCIATFITVLNQTFLSPAIPSITKDFCIDSLSAQWLITVFMLVSSIVMPLNAYFLEHYNLRRLFVFAMLFFSVGCLCSAYGLSFFVVLIGRIFQAVGAGILSPMTASVMMILYPKEKRGSAVGLHGLITGIAPAIAPALSGFLVQCVSWRIMFFIVFVFSFLIFVLGIRYITISKVLKVNNSKLDKGSLLLESVGFGILLYGLSTFKTFDLVFSDIIINLLFVGIGLLLSVLFFVRQKYISNPLLNLNVFLNKNFAFSSIIVIIIQASGMINAMLIPIFIQNVCGHSPIISGLITVPGALCVVFLNPVFGRVFDKHGARFMSVLSAFLLFMVSMLQGLCTSEVSLIYYCFLLTIRSVSLLMNLRSLAIWGINSLKKEEIPHGYSLRVSLLNIFGGIFTPLLILIAVFVEHYFFLGTESYKLLNFDTSMVIINIIFILQGIICFVCFLLIVKNKNIK